MRSIKPDKDILVSTIRIPTASGSIPVLVLSPKAGAQNTAGILWIHGGGYIAGMKEMVHMSRAVDLVKRFGAVVISPGYRLAIQRPFPAAAEDCYSALVYLKDHAQEFGIRRDQIMVGGESAGGGLCAAVCLMARDRKSVVNIAFQMPLYPVLDDRDTESSRDNHGKVWNTRKNHLAWKLYLRGTLKVQVPAYAAPARAQDFADLPPAYTFVGDGEPFYVETLRYIENLKRAGIPAEVNVYHTDIHAFDMMQPELAISKIAAEKFNQAFAYAKEHYFAENL